MARRSKYTPETVDRIVQAIGQGATYELAAAYGGISYQTFNEWMKGKAEFSEVIKQAEGQAAVKWLLKIEKAATNGQWQAAAWKLERRYPEQYGRQVIDHNHSHKLMLSEIERIAAQEGWDDMQKSEAVKEAERIMAGQS